MDKFSDIFLNVSILYFYYIMFIEIKHMRNKVKLLIFLLKYTHYKDLNIFVFSPLQL